MSRKSFFLMLVVAIVCLFSLNSCVLRWWETYHRTTYIIDFYELDSIYVHPVTTEIEGSEYVQLKILPTESVRSVLSLFDDDTAPFYQKCVQHGDVDYCDLWQPEVTMGPLYHSSYLLDEIAEIEITAEDRWDEHHPAGSSLNDLVYIVGLTAQPFIDAGYVGFDYNVTPCSEFFYSIYDNFRCGEDGMGIFNWYPIDKPLTELTSDDMHLWGCGHPGLAISKVNYANPKDGISELLATLILPLHEGEDPVGVKVKLTNSVGKTFTVDLVI